MIYKWSIFQSYVSLPLVKSSAFMGRRPCIHVWYCIYNYRWRHIYIYIYLHLQLYTYVYVPMSSTAWKMLKDLFLFTFWNRRVRCVGKKEPGGISSDATWGSRRFRTSNTASPPRAIVAPSWLSWRRMTSLAQGRRRSGVPWRRWTMVHDVQHM